MDQASFKKFPSGRCFSCFFWERRVDTVSRDCKGEKSCLGASLLNCFARGAKILAHTWATSELLRRPDTASSPNSALKSHFGAAINHGLPRLSSNLWNVKEAKAEAINSLLQANQSPEKTRARENLCAPRLHTEGHSFSCLLFLLMWWSTCACPVCFGEEHEINLPAWKRTRETAKL